MGLKSVTRGFGLLERFLSIQRMKKAQKLIKKKKKTGIILDIGCGSYPLFLVSSNFNDKYGIDQEINDIHIKSQNLNLIKHNILTNQKLPFPKNNFDVITMLAVIEHLNYNIIITILKECYSILKKDGILIITTPAKWSNLPLKIIAKFHLVSREEIEEHKNAFTSQELNQILYKANFKHKNIQNGYFEFCLNLWLCAQK